MAYFILAKDDSSGQRGEALYVLLSPMAPKKSYSTMMEAQGAAKTYLEFHPEAVLLVLQDVAKVVLAPVVTMLVEDPQRAEIRHNLGPANSESSGLPAPTIPHRTAPQHPNEAPVTPANLDELNHQIAEEAKKGSPRKPQVGPRLLILTDRPATAEEMTQYKMVVVGRVVAKNAFGALEFDDLPLTSEERLELKNALHL